MKPILFPEGQKDFSTNGLGRLPDAISCKVTEERNGQYELHMEYPIDGQLMEEIRYSRNIVATSADGKRPQPFRISRITKPLSGVVEIDAEHTSYQITHSPSRPFLGVPCKGQGQGLQRGVGEIPGAVQVAALQPEVDLHLHGAAVAVPSAALVGQGEQGQRIVL